MSVVRDRNIKAQRKYKIFISYKIFYFFGGLVRHPVINNSLVLLVFTQPILKLPVTATTAPKRWQDVTTLNFCSAAKPAKTISS